MANKKEKFKVTEEMISKASDYIPYFEKVTIASDLAKSCIETVDKITNGIATETQLPIPQLYKEQTGAKQYFLMYYFLTKYLHIDLKVDKWNDGQYDYYASSHIFNQLERFKAWCVNRDCLKSIPIDTPEYAIKTKQLREKENAIKNKVFDILYDYKQLKQMLETEIYNLKESKNNSLDRIQDSISLFANPDNIKQLNNLLQKTIADTEVAQKKLAEKRTATKKAESNPTEKK